MFSISVCLFVSLKQLIIVVWMSPDDIKKSGSFYKRYANVQQEWILSNVDPVFADGVSWRRPSVWQFHLLTNPLCE